MGAAGFVVGWTLMMAAMMLPSIVPLAALLPGGQTRLAAGYLSTWAATGLVPWEAMEHGLSPALPLVLAAAMSLAAAAIVGGVVYVQKVLPLGETTARLTGAVLLASAAVVAVA